MPAPRVVEHLDVIERVGPRFFSRDVLLAVDTLDLQTGEEALHRRVDAPMSRKVRRVPQVSQD